MFDFTKEFKLQGKWWIPGEDSDEDNALYGEFHFSLVEGLSLVLIGSLYDSKNILSAKHDIKLSVLYGRLKSREFVTLFNIKGFETGTDSWIETELTMECAFKCKEPFFVVEGMAVTGINFSTDFFHPFFRGYSERLKPAFQNDNIAFTYNEIPPLQVFKNKTDAYFYFSYRFGGIGMTKGSFDISEKIYLNIFCEKPNLPDQIIQKTNFYRDFFSLLAQERVSYQHVNIFSRNEKDEQVEFSVIFKDPGSVANSSLSEFDVLLRYMEIEEIFSTVFQKWFDNEEIIQSGLLLYMQTKKMKFPSVIQSFLNLVFAIETLHNMFSYNGKMVFREKLKDLLSKQQGLIDEFIYDVEDFCTRIKNQRNFLAHNHSEEDKAGFSAKSYPYFNAMLSLIFESAFQCYLGITPELIAKSLKRNFAYQHYLRNIQSIKNDFDAL